MRYNIKSGDTRSTACVLLAFLAMAGCARSPQQKQARLLQQGREYMAKHDYARAILDFRSAAALAPNNAESHYQLGLAYLKAGSPTRAAAAFATTLKLDPRNTGAQVKMAELQAVSGDPVLRQRGEQSLQKVLAGSPHQVEALEALALAELVQNRLDQARSHMEESLATQPGGLRSSLALARVKLAQKDPAGAEAVLRRCVDEAPGSAEAAMSLADFYLQASRPEQAEQWFRRALKLDPRNALALLGIASAQINSGRGEQAEQTYRELSALPGKRYSHLFAVYLLYRGRFDDAVREFEKLAARDPHDRLARNRLVGVYIHTGRRREAMAVLDASVKASPRDADARMLRAQLLVDAGMFAQAEPDLMEVEHARPEAAQVHYLLAKVAQSTNSTERERQELAETLVRNPYLLNARLDLARNLMNANSAKSALAVLNETPEEQRDTADYLIGRNWALLGAGDDAEARSGIDRGFAVAPDHKPELLSQDGIWKLHRKRYAEARASLTEALQLNPQDARSLEALKEAAAFDRSVHKR